MVTFPASPSRHSASQRKDMLLTPYMFLGCSVPACQDVLGCQVNGQLEMVFVYEDLTSFISVVSLILRENPLKVKQGALGGSIETGSILFCSGNKFMVQLWLKIQKSFVGCGCGCGCRCVWVLTEMYKNEARLSTEGKSVLTAWFANEDFFISLYGRHFSIIRIRWNLQLQSSDKSIFKGI